MEEERLGTFRNRWTTISAGSTIAVLGVSCLLGFVLLPQLDAKQQVTGLWEAICKAAGIPVDSGKSETVLSSHKTSKVQLSSHAGQDPNSIGRGATLAQQCAICHGPTGVSRADSPNLAGQYASVVYKQLRDFRDGVRVNAVMSPFAANLSERDMHDLSAYYAYLPRLPGYHPPEATPPPRIVESGSPLRGIAPCGSCHGGIENKLGSPWLEGQSEAYLRAQLIEFASGTRVNDINAQMRNIARAMTPTEIADAAKYFANKPVPTEQGER